MPTRYDRSILQSHADTLYEKADNIVLSAAVASAISLGVGSAAAGFAVAYGFALDVAACAGFSLIAGGVIGFAWGWHLGQEQAFRLRLQAQELLCQMMIEKNTADLVRHTAGQSARTVVQLDEATLQALRPGRSLRMRMSRLGQ
jgi:hypothetical protein